jgi:hypothetical protein
LSAPRRGFRVMTVSFPSTRLLLTISKNEPIGFQSSGGLTSGSIFSSRSRVAHTIKRIYVNALACTSVQNREMAPSKFAPTSTSPMLRILYRARRNHGGHTIASQ